MEENTYCANFIPFHNQMCHFCSILAQTLVFWEICLCKYAQVFVESLKSEASSASYKRCFLVVGWNVLAAVFFFQRAIFRRTFQQGWSLETSHWKIIWQFSLYLADVNTFYCCVLSLGIPLSARLKYTVRSPGSARTSVGIYKNHLFVAHN